MNAILWAVIWFVILGAVFGVLLAIASIIFKVKTDPKEEEIISVLPGANCGGCGYAGCAGLAAAIAKGNAPANACNAGGDEVAEKIAEIMGVSADKSNRKRAQVMCSGCTGDADIKYEYHGVRDCFAASALIGGIKECPNGCIGFGSCVQACKFDAIKLINGVAAVDYRKCTGCGACVEACPKHLIYLIPYDAEHWVGCRNAAPGKLTRTYCKIGCIACKICEKNCPEEAIKVINNTAIIDYDKCTNCGNCVEKCPRHIIWTSKDNDEFLANTK